MVLTPPGQPSVQIGLIDQVSEYTPRHAWGMHEGTYLTFVVDDVFEVMDRAREMALRDRVGSGGARLRQTTRGARSATSMAW